MRNFKISLTLIFVLILSCYSLPVKETSSSTSTERPNDHKKDNDDSPTQNLENIIGEFTENSNRDESLQRD